MAERTQGLSIGYLNQDFAPEVGAGPARISEMSRRWQDAHGARVTVLTGMPNRRIPGRGEGAIDPRYRRKFFMEENWDGIRTLRSWVFSTKRQGFAFKLLNNATFMASGFVHGALRRERFDVMIASSPPFLPHVTGVGLAGLGRMPLVLELRDLWPDYLVEMGVLGDGVAKKALFALERALLARADHVVVVTESFRQRVAAKGVPLDRISVIPNGVDLSQYHADATSAPAAGARNGKFVVGYLGTFGRGQDLASVVEAASIVARRDPHVSFKLIGDGPERQRVQDALERTGAPNVTVLPPIPRDETRAFYNSCDVCLVPLAPLAIFQETIPSKLFEIMACERPIVASVAGEAARILEHSGGGVQATPGDPRAIADAVLRLRAEPEAALKTMGQQARAYVAEHYDRMRLADRYYDILTRVVRARA